MVDSLTGTLDLDASGYGDHIIYFRAPLIWDVIYCHRFGAYWLRCLILFCSGYFCLYDMSPYPVIDNPLTGTFTCSDCSINPVSGKLNLMSTGVGGPYTIYYNAIPPAIWIPFAVWIIDRSAADSSIYYAERHLLHQWRSFPIFISGDGNFTSTNAVVNYSSGKIDIIHRHGRTVHYLLYGK